MIVVDTSVWVDHFRHTDVGLVNALEGEEVLVHPFVIGELACGNLHARGNVLDLLSRLPAAPRASDEEVLAFIEKRSLSGRGIGLIDVHLLASTVLHGSARLWTHDRPLARVAERMRLLYRAIGPLAVSAAGGPR
jgi:predicted nucleic acid-binding protein